MNYFITRTLTSSRNSANIFISSARSFRSSSRFWRRAKTFSCKLTLFRFKEVKFPFLKKKKKLEQIKITIKFKFNTLKIVQNLQARSIKSWAVCCGIRHHSFAERPSFRLLSLVTYFSIQLPLRFLLPFSSFDRCVGFLFLFRLDLILLGFGFQ